MLQKFMRLFTRDTKHDLYRAGQDYMAKLLEKYPDPLAYEQAHKVERDYDNPFDKGLLDFIEEYKARQKGQIHDG